MALEVSSSNFDEVLESDKLVVLDFWAPWCGPCRTIAPIIEELSSEYEGKVIVGKVNVDDNAEIANKFGVRNIPTVVFIKGGEVVDKEVGAAKKDKFVNKIDALL